MTAGRSLCLAVFASIVFPAFLYAQEAAVTGTHEATVSGALERCFEAGQPCALEQHAARETDGRSALLAPDLERRAGSDQKFKVLLGTFLTAAGTDIGLSMYQIGRGAARERGFGAWWQDSPVTFGITKSGAMAFTVYGLDRIHRTRPKTAFILGLVATSVEIALVARSATMKPQAR